MSSVHLQPHSLAHEAPPPQIKEVSPGIFAYVQLDGSWGLNNPAFVGKKAVTLVDTNLHPSARARTQARGLAIESVTPLPVRTLLNTHHHGDHVFGNFVFPEATIIGHRLCREETLQTQLSTQAFFPGVEWGNIEVEPPCVTFDDRITVYVDDLEMQFMFVGPAHTPNDAILWIPSRKLLIAGNLVFSKCTPFVLQGSLAGHIRAMGVLQALGAETVIPGHGDICGPQAINDGLAYLSFVQEVGKKSWDAGVTPLEAARQTDLGRFREWAEWERLAANLHRAIQSYAVTRRARHSHSRRSPT
ncbi:MAG: MBL fold metallo-hydrolase [Chloroflexota bacterium]|nr:MBL fold metallo-hydrolase [Chloroflexota bacterium]